MASWASAAVVSVLLDHLPCGVVILTRDRRLVGFNRRASQILGLELEEMDFAGSNLARWQASSRDGRPLAAEALPAVRAFSEGEVKDEEMSLTRPDGRQVWLRIDSVCIDDPDEGEISVTSFIDVTERHQADVALRGQAAKLREQTTKADEMLRSVNVQHRQQQAIADLGRTALEGAGEDELMTRACELVAATLPADRARLMELIPDERKLRMRAGTGWGDGVVGSAVIPMDGSQAGYLLDSNEPLIIEDFRKEKRFSWLLREHPVVSGIRAVIRGPENPFGELGAYTVRRRQFTDDDVYFMRVMANTLAEALIRIKTTAELETSLRQLRETDAARRQLLKRLANAVEEERSRIARDIHDDALQALAALGLRLELLGGQVVLEESKVRLDQIRASLKHSTDRLRQLIFDLRPDALEVGLETAIRFWFEQTHTELDPELTVESSIEQEPLPERRLAIYRACQEALNNVRKHAQASHVLVTLKDQDAGLEVVIADDGKGFRVSSAPRQGHLGLAAMRERAELLGGSCEITSRPRRGTRVRFWFPALTRSRAPNTSP